jgi:hypothetical protein
MSLSLFTQDLDLNGAPPMPSPVINPNSKFARTLNPTPFGFYDDDVSFQNEADSMVMFVKRKMGDDVLSVELTAKEIYACLEEATLEYSRAVQELKIVSELVNVLGQPTGSTDLTNHYPQRTMEFLLRLADAYAYAANVGGNFDSTLGYITLVGGQQDYDIYSMISAANPSQLVVDTLPSGSVGKLRIVEVFHFEPIAAQSFLLNASNITNFLATNFNYESYVNSTVFYVLPVFEDVVRRGMLKEAFRVRRSNYSYQIIGTNLRIFPIPSSDLDTGNMYVRVTTPPNVLDPDFQDDSIYGVSGPENVPFSILPYSTITQPGRQWIRQYTLALSREVLGLTRSKIKTIPIPNADLELNGTDLVAQAREDKEKLTTNLHEFLDKLTNQALLESQAAIGDAMQKLLRQIPMPSGHAVIFG